MKKHFFIDHGTFPFDIAVFIGYEHLEMLKRLEKLTELTEEEKEELEMEGLGRTVMLSGNRTVMQFKNIVCPIKFHGIVNHEIFHAVEFLFDRVGIPHDSSTTSESYAYQGQYLTEKFYKEFYKKSAQKNRKSPKRG